MSISKIAKELNVSKSTVSLVINGKAEQSRISKQLTKRILDYVEEIGFKPNALAKSLATGKSRTIGLIVENIGDSFFGPIALHIEACLRSYGYHVLYSSTIGEDEVAKDILMAMVDQKVEGIILSPTTNLEDQVRKIIKSNIPLVIFDRKLLTLETNYVGTDNYEASHSAVEHLLDQGYSKIGMVTSDSQQSQMTERLQAYKDCLEKNALQPHVLQVPFFSNPVQRIEAIHDFLISNDLEALYFSTNYLCISGIKAMDSLERKTPYAILSFDDHEVFEMLTPAITCVRQPIDQIAEQAVQNLLHQINNGSSELKQDIIPSQLIVRHSTVKES